MDKKPPQKHNNQKKVDVFVTVVDFLLKNGISVYAVIFEKKKK